MFNVSRTLNFSNPRSGTAGQKEYNYCRKFEKNICFLFFTTTTKKPTRSQFHQHFTNSFCANFLAPKNYKPKCKHRQAAQNTFVWKSCSQIVGEIDSRSDNLFRLENGLILTSNCALLFATWSHPLIVQGNKFPSPSPDWKEIGSNWVKNYVIDSRCAIMCVPSVRVHEVLHQMKNRAIQLSHMTQCVAGRWKMTAKMMTSFLEVRID